MLDSLKVLFFFKITPINKLTSFIDPLICLLNFSRAFSPIQCVYCPHELLSPTVFLQPFQSSTVHPPCFTFLFCGFTPHYCPLLCSTVAGTGEEVWAEPALGSFDSASPLFDSRFDIFILPGCIRRLLVNCLEATFKGYLGTSIH